MASKVLLLTSAAAMCSLMVVVYMHMAVVPNSWHQSVWNIENKHIYFIQTSRERAQQERGTQRVNTTRMYNQRVNTTRMYDQTHAAVSMGLGTQIPSFSPAMSALRSELSRTAAAKGAMLWPNCSDRMCSEYLSPADKAAFKLCANKAKVNLRHVTPKNGSCHFMDGSRRQPIALISLPGSGNTWVRGLLETATNICTGFLFCDISLRAEGFIGENIQSGSVLVVKTHQIMPFWGESRSSKKKTHFGSAIFVVRNPLDAHVAEWNRKVTNGFRGMTVAVQSHVKRAGKEWFGECS